MPSRSTCDAMISVCHTILSDLDRSTPICGVFLDLKKAFDSVSHTSLLSQLFSINLPNHICHWLASYLSGRTQSVRVGKSVSSSQPVLSGVPQGSILGPLLFIFYINDIVTLNPHFSLNLFLYADDMLLLHPLNHTADIATINSLLSDIHCWLSSRSLNINLQKSKFMIFSLRPQSFFDSLPPVQISNILLDRVYSYKYLGLSFQPNLSWSSHIHNIRMKARKRLGLIYRHFYHHCPSSTLLTLYKMLVRPILEYGAAIWDPPSLTAKSSLESVQHFALKMASKSWASSYPSLLSQFAIKPLEQRRNICKASSLFKLKFGFSHSINCPLISPSPPLHFSRNYNRHDFAPIFCKSATYMNSFYPTSIKLWNSLPSCIKSTDSFSLFKSKLFTIF